MSVSAGCVSLHELPVLLAEVQGCSVLSAASHSFTLLQMGKWGREAPHTSTDLPLQTSLHSQAP